MVSPTTTESGQEEETNHPSCSVQLETVEADEESNIGICLDRAERELNKSI